MKSVLLSIKPKYCELIAAGKKTIEVRKTKPKLKTPFKCFIYECKGKEVSKIIDIPKEQGGGVLDYYEYEGCGKVIGEFVCDAIIVDKTFGHDDLFNAAACLSVAEVAAYCINKETFGWHISDLVIYDKPKELSEFMVIDKEMLKECPYRIRAYNNPDCTNGALLKGTYVCNNSFEPDFCRGQCEIATKPLTHPPQSWCYVEGTY